MSFFKKKNKTVFEQLEISEQELRNHIESLIFVAENPITFKDINETLHKSIDLQVSDELISSQVEVLRAKYDKADSAIELMNIGKGFLFMTKSAYHKSISSFLNLTAKKRFSKSAMETLAIIAYKQPVTKVDIEQIRGVSADYSIQKLLEQEMIEPAGRTEAVGKAMMYRTSAQFMQHFGLNNMKDLPKYSEIIPEVNRIEKEMLEDSEAPTTNDESVSNNDTI